MITGSRNGEIVLTDLPRSCYSKLDKIGEAITSIGMNSRLEILVSTANSRLYEYVSLRDI